MSVNKVILIGNAGRDAEVKTAGNGGQFATFTLATSDRGYTKRDGTQVPERTEWHNIVLGTGMVNVAKYIIKGTKVYVEGKLHTRSYTAKDNSQRYVTEVWADNLELLSQKPQQQQAAPYAPAPAPAAPAAPAPVPQPQQQPLFGVDNNGQIPW